MNLDFQLSLTLMWKGMLAIFTVIIVIYLVLLVLGIKRKPKKNTHSE